MAKEASNNSIEYKKKRAAIVARELKKLFPDARIALNFGNPWELLVAVVLSAQCTDKKVNEVTAKLFKKYRKLEDYVRADIKEFEKDVHSTGFYHNKAKNVLAAAKIIKDKYEGGVPCTMEELVELPGVARKTANIILGNACGVVVGIPVDTHVRRLSNVLGLSAQSDPVKIEKDLMEIFPKKEWETISYRLIEYGRTYCPAKKHDHASCPLAKILK
ncbi:MAG TPA: endonuclease III [Patescibacteria group bacterium]